MSETARKLAYLGALVRVSDAQSYTVGRVRHRVCHCVDLIGSRSSRVSNGDVSTCPHSRPSVDNVNMLALDIQPIFDITWGRDVAKADQDIL
jgi:hypothetical protein